MSRMSVSVSVQIIVRVSRVSVHRYKCVERVSQ